MTKQKYIPPIAETICFHPESAPLCESDKIEIKDNENVDFSDKSSRHEWYEESQNYWGED